MQQVADVEEECPPGLVRARGSISSMCVTPPRTSYDISLEERARQQRHHANGGRGRRNRKDEYDG